MKLPWLMLPISLTCACGGGNGASVPNGALISVTGVSLNNSALNLTSGSSTATLVATVIPANATNPAVNWNSSNPAAATVAGGVVTPVATGSTAITVTTVDGGKTATCSVNVAAAPSTCPIPQAIAIPSFATDILPALQSSCGSQATSCHGGGPSPAGHVIYSGTPAQVYAQLVNVVPANAPAGFDLVKPNDTAHSWILVKVTQDQPGGTGYGARMPLAAPNLCQSTIDTLTNWINQGAANN